MAEGGEQVSGRREKLDRNCKPCLSKGTEKLAEKYCLVCERSFCQECKELHNVLLGDHQLIEIESEDVAAASTSQSLETCPEHGKVRNLYCTEDEVAGCEMCIDKEHRSCKEAVYLPKAAKKFLKDVDMDEVHAQVRKTIDRLQSIQLDQASTLSSLEADRGRCLKQIDDHHKELLDLMDKIVASSKDNVETTFKSLSTDLHRHNQDIKKCLGDLETSETSIERYRGNDIQLFVQLKKFQKQLKANEEVSMLSLENLKARGFNVAIDNRLHDLLLNVDQLVTISNRVPTQVKETYTIDIGPKKKRCIPMVFGTCVLSDGCVLVPDYENKQLKLIDTRSRTTIDQCEMSAGPCDVCCINKNEVAVTLWNWTVVFVSVKPLTPIRSISMNHTCMYCAYSQSELYISDQKKTLYIYNTEGSLLRKIMTDTSGKEIFSKIRNIAINDDRDTVYVADIVEGLVVMDRHGVVMDKHFSNKIQGHCGVCLDGTGGLFVCGRATNNVIHMAADGQILAELLTSSDGLLNPTSVCFDVVRKRLFVSQRYSKQLHVCELE